MGNGFNFNHNDNSERDQAYLSRKRERFDDMDLDEKVPASSYHFSSQLRGINAQFFSDPSQQGLADTAQKLKDKTRAKNTNKKHKAG